MTEGAPALVMFERPPVTEVALGAIFAPLEKLRAIHLGLFWQQIREQFPDAEQQPPILRVLEQPGNEPAPGTVSFPLPFAFGEEQRNILSNHDRSRLLQLQRDRFASNWCKVAVDQKYPGYCADMRPTFSRYWSAFVEFLKSNDLGSPKIDQCDVEYVDDIPQGEGWETFEDVPKMIAPWSGVFSPSEAMPAPSSLSLSASFPIAENRGHVYLGMQPIRRPGQARQVLRIRVSARVIPSGDESQTVLDLMDIGHQCASNSFIAFTTPNIHRHWGKR